MNTTPSVHQVPESPELKLSSELARALTHPDGREARVKAVAELIEQDNQAITLLLKILKDPSSTEARWALVLDSFAAASTAVLSIRTVLIEFLPLDNVPGGDKIKAKIVDTVKKISNTTDEADEHLLKCLLDYRSRSQILSDLEARSGYSDALVSSLAALALNSRDPGNTVPYTLLSSLIAKRPDHSDVISLAKSRIENFAVRHQKVLFSENENLSLQILSLASSLDDKSTALEIANAGLQLVENPKVAAAACDVIVQLGAFSEEISQSLVVLYQENTSLRHSAVKALKTIYQNHGGDKAVYRLLLSFELQVKVPDGPISDYPLEVIGGLSQLGDVSAFDELKRQATADRADSTAKIVLALSEASKSEDFKISREAFALLARISPEKASLAFYHQFDAPGVKLDKEQELRMLLIADVIGELALGPRVVRRICKMALKRDAVPEHYPYHSKPEEQTFEVVLGSQQSGQDVRRAALRALSHADDFFTTQVKDTLTASVGCSIERSRVFKFLLSQGSRDTAERVDLDMNLELLPKTKEFDVDSVTIPVPILKVMKRWAPVSKKALRRREQAIRSWAKLASENEDALKAAGDLLKNPQRMVRNAGVIILAQVGRLAAPYLDKMAKTIAADIKKTWSEREGASQATVDFEDANIERMKKAFFHLYRKAEAVDFNFLDDLKPSHSDPFSLRATAAAHRITHLPESELREWGSDEFAKAVAMLTTRAGLSNESEMRKALIALARKSPDKVVPMILDFRNDLRKPVSEYDSGFNARSSIQRWCSWHDEVLEELGEAARSYLEEDLSKRLSA